MSVEAPGARAGRGLERAALTLLLFATWAISHQYRGIAHDARLYTLQALAHLDPSLHGDVFLRFGSQENFTLFSPLYAAAIRLLGAENAAAALTLAFQTGLLFAAWMLARSVMSRSMAVLGVCVLVAIPGDYGPGHVFTCLESFVTPRMAAEALALGGLAAVLRGRTAMAALLIVMAGLLHPLMAAAGLAATCCLCCVITHPRRALPLGASALVLLTAIGLMLPIGPLGRFDPDWLELVKGRSPFLFLAYWKSADWAWAATIAATLGQAATLDRAPALRAATDTDGSRRIRDLSIAVLLTMFAGLVLSGLGCDLLGLVLVVQSQTWRWLWLGTVVAALLLPLVLRVEWHSGYAGRTRATLLTAAWLFGANDFAWTPLLSLAVCAGLASRVTRRELYLLFLGACGLLAIAVVWRVASNLEFTDAHYLDPRVAMWQRRATSFMHDGALPAAAAGIIVWCAARRRARAALILCAGAAGAACIIVGPLCWNSWMQRDYPAERRAQFAAMRTLIPPGAEVFWPESPVATWLLLDRPSYISVIQTAGMVFSRSGARELRRRAEALGVAIPPPTFLGWELGGAGLNLTQRQLLDACDTGAFAFLVTAGDLGRPPLATVEPMPPERPQAASSAGRPKGIRLYRCGSVSPPASS